jgi:hypothetical protein
MAKAPSLTTITSGYASNTQLNNNFDAIEAAFENTLSLDGSTPNALNADLDMNSKDILNVNEVDTSYLRINGQLVVPTDYAVATDATDVNYNQGGTGAVSRTVANRLQDYVSVKDFGAKGDGVTDDTAAIQAAINGDIRNIHVPAGNYKITSSLTLQQGTRLFGDGSNNEIQSHKITKILSFGDFNALVVNSGAPGYFGFIAVKDLSIIKSSGSTKTNSGLKAQNFAPHVILENVLIENYDIGFDINTGLATISSCNARFNNIGFKLNATSTNLIGCYSNRNITGYRFVEPFTYSSLISCAADINTGNAYEFIGTTGPLNNLEVQSVAVMQSCGAEVCGAYLYVDGNFSLTVESPIAASMTGKPKIANIETARRVTFKNLDGVTALDWLYVNRSKCTDDVVVVEGDYPRMNQSVPPASIYSNVPIVMSGLKQSIGTFTLAKTRIPFLANSASDASAGGAAQASSFAYKGLFASSSPVTNRLRLRVKVLGNGFTSTARVKLSQFIFISGAGNAGGDVYLTAQNVAGITTVAGSSAADVTVLQSTAASPDGFTYQYFFLESSRSFVYLWDIEAFCNFEVFSTTDAFALYKNWSAGNASATTTGGITTGTPTLIVASGAGITNGMQILVNGAGAAGATFISTVVSGGGTTTLTLSTNAGTTVVAAAVSAYSL